ncbi:MAG: DUF3299 domain-containing protein [Phycisphaeraceae bacterium]
MAREDTDAPAPYRPVSLLFTLGAPFLIIAAMALWFLLDPFGLRVRYDPDESWQQYPSTSYPAKGMKITQVDRTRADTFDPADAAVTDGALEISFAVLRGFPLTGPGSIVERDPTSIVIPESILALDGREIIVQGYMMPIDFEDNSTNEFILSPMLAENYYEQSPQLNDWIEVKMESGKRTPYLQDALCRVRGTIKVAVVYEDGVAVGLYQMTATQVESIFGQ